MKTNPRRRTDNIVEQKLEQEVLLYKLEANKAFCLNETSALIWELCDGTNTVREISKTAMGKQVSMKSRFYRSLRPQ